MRWQIGCIQPTFPLLSPATEKAETTLPLHPLPVDEAAGPHSRRPPLRRRGGGVVAPDLQFGGINRVGRVRVSVPGDVQPPPLRISCAESSSRCRRAATGWRCGAGLSWRGRWCGGDLAVDFCSTFLSVTRRHRLLRRREEGGKFAGASDAGLLRLAAGRRMPWSVLGVWSVESGSGAAPRCRRREGLDLEIEGELGDEPRPACHSDRWAPWVLLLVVLKALRRWSFFNLGFGGRRLVFSRCSGVGDGRRFRSCGAEFPKGFFVILPFFRGLSAFCTGPGVFLDRICSLCTYSVLRMVST